MRAIDFSYMPSFYNKKKHFIFRSGPNNLKKTKNESKTKQNRTKNEILLIANKAMA